MHFIDNVENIINKIHHRMLKCICWLFVYFRKDIMFVPQKLHY